MTSLKNMCPIAPVTKKLTNCVLLCTFIPYQLYPIYTIEQTPSRHRANMKHA